ncbi:MAG: hypothetical protein QOH13_2593, partial [Thermoleophilaceae bacterium]|nr:hypothetical protein [Thermoleophilaceae bacterium]
FRTSKDPWIVAVNMVSEGVDIPRLRVGVYATAAKTPLIFRQIVGRFVRTIAGRPAEPSWLYLPADPVLRGHAAEVETELRHVLRPRDEDEYALDEPAARRETERTETPEWAPLAADVAPQMTLFGGPAPALTVATLAAPPVPALAGAGASAFPSAVAEEPDPSARPAFERRALLRDKRRRLVADLRRIDGRSHRDINAWLNRATGIARVDDATIAQLERSVDLLLGALTAKR